MSSVSAPASENDVEFVVSHELAAAALRDGVRLPEGYRVRLTFVSSTDDEPPQRSIPWLGSVRSGQRNLGARTKDIVREEMGR